MSESAVPTVMAPQMPATQSMDFHADPRTPYCRASSGSPHEVVSLVPIASSPVK